MLMMVSKIDKNIYKFNPLEVINDLKHMNEELDINDEVPQEVINRIIIAIEEYDLPMIQETLIEKTVGDCLMQAGYYNAARKYIIYKYQEDEALALSKRLMVEQPKEEEKKTNKFNLFKR